MQQRSNTVTAAVSSVIAVIEGFCLSSCLSTQRVLVGCDDDDDDDDCILPFSKSTEMCNEISTQSKKQNILIET